MAVLHRSTPSCTQRLASRYVAVYSTTYYVNVLVKVGHFEHTGIVQDERVVQNPLYLDTFLLLDQANSPLDGVIAEELDDVDLTLLARANGSTKRLFLNIGIPLRRYEDDFGGMYEGDAFVPSLGRDEHHEAVV